MSARPTTALQDARVSKETFLGFLWAGTAISLSFLIFRVAVRIKSFKKLFADDILVILAWTMLLATSITWQIEAPILYEEYDIQAQRKFPGPDFLVKYEKFLHSVAPLNILFYTTLWSVKLSFLMFFRRLGSKVNGHKVWWYVVLAITIAALIASVGDIDYRCSFNSIEWIIVQCTSLKRIHFENRTFYANCAADILTDCLILSIPIMMLWNVQIPWRKKLALFAVFSVTVVVMVVSVIRVTIVNTADQNVDISWLYFWSNVEVCTSIIIACVASFRQLFVNNKKQSSDSESSKLRGLLDYFRSKAKSSSASLDIKWPKRSKRNEASSERSESQASIVSMQGIHVDQQFGVANHASRVETDKIPYQVINDVRAGQGSFPPLQGDYRFEKAHIQDTGPNIQYLA